MAFLGFTCPNCGNTSFEQTLRFKWIHVLLVLFTCGLWIGVLLLNSLFKFFWNQPILPTHNRCCRCGSTFSRQSLS